MISKQILLSGCIAISLFTACSDDDDNGGATIQTPSLYAFSRDNQSTVSFSGQTTRIKMATELASGLKESTNDLSTLNAMFAHEEGNDDFSDAELNASSKSARSKVAASKDYFSANTTLSNQIKADFDDWIAGQVNDVFPRWDDLATEGNAGNIQESAGGSARYVNAKGLEYDQAVAKGFIGALMVDQILNNYLSTSVLDEGSNVENNNNGTLEDGKSYTTMEHKWDEAYGYLYGTASDPANPNTNIGSDDGFLNKYVGRVEDDPDFEGIADDIFNAFALGRAAIVVKDYTLRNQQAEILRERISLVIAVRAVYYLQQGKVRMDENNTGSAFHNLSEGFGFIYSLQFTRQPNSTEPYFTNAEVNAFLDLLLADDGFWDVSATTLDQISTDIANKFGFSVEAVAN